MPEQYYQELLHYFTRQCGNIETARDVVQEAYTNMLQYQQNKGTVREPRALLYHIGRNVLNTQYARQRTEARVLQTFALLHRDSEASTEEIVNWRQQFGRLIALLEQMPSRRREVFILVRIHGLSYQEAAEHLGLRVPTVETHLVRALMDCAGFRRE